MQFWLKWIAVAAVLAGLTACATGPRTVDADVRTVAAQAPGAAVLLNARYRFERGPLVAGQPAPDKLEAMAQAALARVGALRDDANAQLSVQVGGYVSAYWRDEWGRPMGYGPRLSLGLGFGGGWRGGGIGLGMGWPLDDPSIPAYVSEVNLLMRDLRTGQIVYDTRARHDGPWHDTDNVLAALFVAALEGYPNPAQTVRRVGVPLVPVANATGGSAPPVPTSGAVPQAVPAPAPGAPVMVTPRH
ncbi:hypothetical protein FVQ98_02450 [Ottowia sp. GY511]|uniref:DUF4136 domain-containing protein n=1 Tax=Ottowia flava TaxID=2675430 RepID=A0ABW4KRU4_9BURK|nr:hypothetical protein [Ottowia sp. GY511]TXK32869.1 hypothetical protein FVQ98_02450 [Ottowia sp. GY511]